MSIRVKLLTALLILVLVPTLVVGVLIFTSAEQNLVNNQIDSLEAIAEIKLKAIKDFSARNIHDFKQISSNPAISQQLETLVNSADQPAGDDFIEATEKMDLLLQPTEAAFGLEVILLTDLHGKVVYQSNHEHPQNHLGTHFNHLDPESLQLASDGAPLIRFYHAVSEQEKAGMVVVGTIRNQSSITGLMIFEIDLARAVNIFLDNTGLGETGKTVLGIKSGEKHFTHLTASLQDPHKDKKLVAFTDPPVAMQKAVSGQNGAGRSRNFSGTELIAAWRYLPELDVGMVAKINAAEALASAQTLKATALAVILIVMVVGALLAQLLVRSITEPILTLKKGIDRVARGELDTRLGLARKDEVGEVANAFDQMMINLAEVTASRDELNREIAEREIAEALLRDREARLRDLFDNANDLIQSIAPDGRILFVNQAWLDTLGYRESEIESLNLFEVIHPESLQHCQLAFQQMMEDGQGGKFEATFKTKSGDKILLEGIVSVHFEDGQPVASRGIFRNITERKLAEEKLEGERSFLQAIIDGVSDPLLVVGLDYQILLMNEASKNNLAEENQNLSNLYCYKVSHQSSEPCSSEEHPCPLAEVKRTGQPVTVVHQHYNKHGERRYFELIASPYRGTDGQLLGIIESSRDISDRLLMEKDLADRDIRLEFLAHHDPLTRLPNRLRFNDRLQHAMSKAQRSAKQVALLFLDLDRFKNINDSLGHAVGDAVLREVANRLRENVREMDTIARLGGDEFLIIVEDLLDSRGAATLAQKIQQSLTIPIHVEGHEFTSTTSIGISMYPSDGQDGEGLLKSADVAMYRAKEQGRNNYQFYTADMNARTHELLVLEADLHKALEQGQMTLHYQPQIDLFSGELVGLEALVRWRHPEKGMVSPADFIPLAEETGLIVPLGEWVIKTACTQNKAWQDAGYPALKMAVNVSARQFHQAGLVSTITSILEETGLSSQWLELEITESVVMKNVTGAIMVMNNLFQKGIHLAIDDFGTGYSSLNYLKRFPISKLKIDRSFITDITHNANDISIAKSIIALADSMNIDVLAEGIETTEQLQLLQEMGCLYGQGFLFSRPVAAAELSPLLQKQRLEDFIAPAESHLPVFSFRFLEDS